MGSESVEVEEKTTPGAHESPSEVDREPEEGVEEQVTPEDEKRGKKRESPEKHEEEPEEGDGSKSKRPARERKTVERYSALSPRKASASKALSIPQGSGTKLKDIPNVVFKLSKRKVDDNLQALHTILFGRKSNTHFLKRNILQFSGFVWTENKEKYKAKVKEKLDKFTKDKLIGFCEVLDIHFPKTSTKKEDVSAKLLEFLESPHVTRDLLLADQEKKGKRRRSRVKVSSEAAEDASLDKETKKHKKSAEPEVKKRRKQSHKTEGDNEPEDSAGSGGTKDASSGEEDNNGLEQESDHDKLEEVEEHESHEPLESKKASDERQAEESAEPEAKGEASPVKKTSSVKADKSPSKHVSKKAAQPVEDEPDAAPDSKHSSTKKQKSSKASTKEKAAMVRKETKKSSGKNVSLDASNSGTSKSSKSKKEDKKKGQNKEKAVPEEKKEKKKEAKPAPKVSTKEQGKGKKKAGPTTEELHSVVSNILKEVDFNTATLADILKQLGAHFDMDLMHRKAEVKSVIEEVINNMTDDEDDDNGDEDDDNLGGNEEGNTKEEESDGHRKK